MVKFYNMKNKIKWIDDIMDDERKLGITIGRWTREELEGMEMKDLERKRGMLLKLWNQQNPSM